MSKAHRGTGIRHEHNSGRGTCPICGRTNIKVLYETTIDEKKAMICKACNAHKKNSK